MGHIPPWTRAPISNIRFKGVFDYEGMMALLYKWMDDRRYIIYERVFKHKAGALPASWEYERELEGQRKVTDYIRYIVNVSIHAWDVVPVEVIKDGQKLKMNKGRMEIRMTIGIELDYSGRWDSTESMEKIRNFFHNHVIKKDIGVKHGDPLYYSMLSLHTQIKKFLGMEGSSSAF